MGYKSIAFILLSCISISVGGDVQCRDENNNPVDWYVIYKLPLVKNGHPLIERGEGYMYITSSSTTSGWQMSDKPIDSNSTLLANTVPFLKGTSKEVFWTVYTDQGKTTCWGCGHTKGVVAGDTNGGFWLVHSIPHFINGTYPRTGLKYGQSALCVSFKSAMLDKVGDLLAYNTAKFQILNIPSKMKELYPKIVAAVNGVTVTSPWKLLQNLTSVNGDSFVAFAKSKQFGQDLYGWVANTLKVDLCVESWINGKHNLPSSCDRLHKVMNLQSLKLQMLNLNFSTHKDHSKWALSASEPIICIGDINRAETQERRGGGTVCLRNQALWKSYRNLIENVELCRR